MLPQLAQLLNNPWFRHFAIKWLQERQNRLEYTAALPVKDMATANLREQVYGEVRTLDGCAKEAYELYAALVEQSKQKESNGPGNTDS